MIKSPTLTGLVQQLCPIRHSRVYMTARGWELSLRAHGQCGKPALAVQTLLEEKNVAVGRKLHSKKASIWSSHLAQHQQGVLRIL